MNVMYLKYHPTQLVFFFSEKHQDFPWSFSYIVYKYNDNETFDIVAEYARYNRNIKYLHKLDTFLYTLKFNYYTCNLCKSYKNDNYSSFSLKALRLSGTARKKTTDGEILNLMSVDTQKIQVKRFINMKYI